MSKGGEVSTGHCGRRDPGGLRSDRGDVWVSQSVSKEDVQSSALVAGAAVGDSLARKAHTARARRRSRERAEGGDRARSLGQSGPPGDTTVSNTRRTRGRRRRRAERGDEAAGSDVVGTSAASTASKAVAPKQFRADRLARGLDR